MVPERVDTAFLAVGAYCGSGRPLNRLLLRNPQEMVFSGKRGLTAAEYEQRPALAGRRSRRIPRRLPQTRLKLSNPLLCSGQLPKCLRQRSLRLGQLAAQRATGAVRISSPESASPGTPGRYYHPQLPTPRSAS